jgi:hypothetical protein
MNYDFPDEDDERDADPKATRRALVIAGVVIMATLVLLWWTIRQTPH